MCIGTKATMIDTMFFFFFFFFITMTKSWPVHELLWWHKIHKQKSKSGGSATPSVRILKYYSLQIYAWPKVQSAIAYAIKQFTYFQTNNVILFCVYFYIFSKQTINQWCGETSKEMTTQFHCSIYFPDCSLIFSTGLLSRLNHRVFFQELCLFTRF